MSPAGNDEAVGGPAETIDRRRLALGVRDWPAYVYSTVAGAEAGGRVNNVPADPVPCRGSPRVQDPGLRARFSPRRAARWRSRRRAPHRVTASLCHRVVISRPQVGATVGARVTVETMTGARSGCIDEEIGHGARRRRACELVMILCAITLPRLQQDDASRRRPRYADPSHSIGRSIAVAPRSLVRSIATGTMSSTLRARSENSGVPSTLAARLSRRQTIPRRLLSATAAGSQRHVRARRHCCSATAPTAASCRDRKLAVAEKHMALALSWTGGAKCASRFAASVHRCVGAG